MLSQRGESGVRAVCTLLAYNSSPAEEGSQSGNRAAPRETSAYTFSGLTSEIQTDCGPLGSRRECDSSDNVESFEKTCLATMGQTLAASVLCYELDGYYHFFDSLVGQVARHCLWKFRRNRTEVREAQFVSKVTNFGTIYCW